MKTLIFNGSPRKNGDTKSLINELIENLIGEYKIVDAYYCNVLPCVDCRYYCQHAGCCMKMGRWMMFRISNDTDLEDYKLLMSIKMKPKKWGGAE